MGAHDVLIVSDLHLRGGYHNPTEGLYHFDEEFADFLRCNERQYIGQRPTSGVMFTEPTQKAR